MMMSVPPKSPDSTDFQEQRHQLRKFMRQQRRLLSPEQQRQAADRLAELALHFAPLRNAQNIALYLPVSGELDTQPLIQQLWQSGKSLWLPVLHPFSANNLLFLQYTPHTILQRNCLNILEPQLDVRHITPLSALDVMLVPLVAFDLNGQRLGMGRGFYDRTLQYWQQHNFLPIGIAHDCQLVPSLPSAEWDVPMPVILTPTQCWQWQR